jgi:hypothetical protein
MKTKNSNPKEFLACAPSLESIAASTPTPTLSEEVRAIESRGYVAVGQPYDGSQTYLDIRSERPLLTQIPYECKS